MLSLQCISCKNKLREPLKCKAFDRIPEAIWTGEFDHTKPYPNDRGIRFEPIDDDDELLKSAL